VLRVKSVNIDTAARLPAECAITRFQADIVQFHLKP
jgi:hypothetical protein